jgi:hypothetical protein
MSTRDLRALALSGAACPVPAERDEARVSICTISTIAAGPVICTVTRRGGAFRPSRCFTQYRSNRT